MQISSMQSYNTLSFGELPKRHYPYRLPAYEYETQAEKQMPEVREEMQSALDEYEKVAVLSNLESAIEKASPYLPENSKRTQRALLNHTYASIQEVPVSVRQKLVNLTLCSAQSAYQQDKHDAIYAYNKISTYPYTSYGNETRLLYGMADAFKNLDRHHDAFEIAKAEDNLRAAYSRQPRAVQTDLEKLYGDGKCLDFIA